MSELLQDEELGEVTENENINDTEEDKPFVRSYVEASDREEDMKSSFYSFFIVAILLLVGDVLVFTDVIPIAVGSTATKILDVTVLSVMAFVFLFIAIYSMERAKTLAKDSKEEIQETEEIIDYCVANYKEPVTDDTSEEDAFFVREKTIRDMITNHFDELDESYLEYVLDIVYSELYPETADAVEEEVEEKESEE